MDAQETKIHLVKNVQKSISMQVEDEVIFEIREKIGLEFILQFA